MSEIDKIMQVVQHSLCFRTKCWSDSWNGYRFPDFGIILF